MNTRLVVAIALVTTACTAPVTQDTEPGVPATEAAVSSTVAQIPESPPADLETVTTTSTHAGNPVPDGPPAPDFTLGLGDGGTFMLSQESRPVYLVFWAEW